jgi:hypothetical protein
VLAWLSISVPTARADEVAPPPPPTEGPPVDVTPASDPAPDPAPPTEPTPPPPPSDPTPHTGQPPGGQETPSPPSNSGSGDQWTTSPDRSSSAGPQQSAGSTSGTSADPQSGAVLATPDTHSSGSAGKGRDSLAIAPGVDDFDSFTGLSTGGTSLLPDGPKACSAIACGGGPRGFVAGVAVSVERLRETAARERDASRVEGLARAMPPTTPGGIPGRAYSMPGSAGGAGGGAPLLISVIAVLATALALDWAKSFRLPTATWRLSAYVPPIEHPG